MDATVIPRPGSGRVVVEATNPLRDDDPDRQTLASTALNLQSYDSIDLGARKDRLYNCLRLVYRACRTACNRLENR
jgi:hypothetical protein